jgi:phosphoglycerate kinase
MNNIKNCKNLDGKIVLLRLDLNVPLKNNLITDETRIIKILPIFNFLIENKAKIVVISHIGRPNGKWKKELSLKPVCESLKKKLNKKIKLITEDIFSLDKQKLFESSKDEIIFLENVRFYEDEEKNENEFSKHLASLGDLYVNDAFSCSHRSHASICEITKYLPSYMGIQFDREVNALKRVTKDIKKPITCIIGGSKISTKISIIKNLIPKFDNIIIVGGMANNVLKL